jgi:beta-lactam-binding protein with PASTA domain
MNILAGIGLLLLLLFVFLSSLELITRHGKVMKIPSVTGQNVQEARKTLESQGFDVQVLDSVYNDTIPPMQVVKQQPESDNLVKVNRTVYLTINRSVPPEIEMPNLVSMTFRNAALILRQYGLKLKDTIFKPDFARNSVLDQMYQGNSIKPGTKIQQGSAITLVLGNGVGLEFNVPALIGLTYQEARTMLEASGLIVGAVVPDPGLRDTTQAYVYRQSPDPLDEGRRPNRIRQGQIIDIWLSATKPSLLPDSAATPANPNAYQ